MSVLSTAAWQSFFTHPSSVPDFCFLFFCFHLVVAFHVVQLHPTPSVFIPILVTDKKHMLCTVWDILLLVINIFPEYNSSYDGVNPFTILFLLLGSGIIRVISTILPLWGFNWGERIFRDLEVHRKPVSLKKPWHCTLTACLHNGTFVITSCFLEIEHVALISPLNKINWRSDISWQTETLLAVI